MANEVKGAEMLKELKEVTNSLAVKIAVKMELPELHIMDTRDVLETLARVPKGRCYVVKYLNVYATDKAKFKEEGKFPFKYGERTHQNCDYEAKSSVKELRASGVEADHTVVKNEVTVTPTIDYNTSSGKFKHRAPTFEKKAETRNARWGWVTVKDGEVVDVKVSKDFDTFKAEYEEYYKYPKPSGEKKQDFFSYKVEGIMEVKCNCEE